MYQALMSIKPDIDGRSCIQQQTAAIGQCHEALLARDSTQIGCPSLLLCHTPAHPATRHGGQQNSQLGHCGPSAATLRSAQRRHGQRRRQPSQLVHQPLGPHPGAFMGGTGLAPALEGDAFGSRQAFIVQTDQPVRSFVQQTCIHCSHSISARHCLKAWAM
jgi:hypothetical protein